MTKVISGALDTHIQQEVTTLATCWRVVRTDNQEFFFTSFNEDIEFPVASGDIYQASTGVTGSNLDVDSSFGVNNAELIGLLLGSGILEADLRKGLFNYADIFVFIVNYNDISMGEIKMSKGKLGEVSTTDAGVFRVEQRGLTQSYKQVIGESYSPECRADLGDSRCKLPIFPDEILRNTAYIVGDFVKVDTAGGPGYEKYENRVYECTVAGTTAGSQPVYDTIVGNTTVDGTATFTARDSFTRHAQIVTVASNKQFTVAELTPVIDFPSAFFNIGAAIWITGNNAGRAQEIQVFTEGVSSQTIRLFLKTPLDISVGDDLAIYPGCLKRLTEDCIGVFDNQENFRGEPFLPGIDFLISTPNSKA